MVSSSLYKKLKIHYGHPVQELRKEVRDYLDLLVLVSLFLHALYQESGNQAGVQPTGEKTTNSPIGQQSLLYRLLKQRPNVSMRVFRDKGSNCASITASNWKIPLRFNQ